MKSLIQPVITIIALVTIIIAITEFKEKLNKSIWTVEYALSNRIDAMEEQLIEEISIIEKNLIEKIKDELNDTNTARPIIKIDPKRKLELEKLIKFDYDQFQKDIEIEKRKRFEKNLKEYNNKLSHQ